MSAVLGPGLAVSRYRAGVVIRHHDDESWPDHHQEGQQIARPLGLHYASANRHNFHFQAGRGIHHKFVAHRPFSFLPARKHYGHHGRQAISTPPTGTNTCRRLSKGKNSSSRKLERRPSALRLHHRNFSGRSGGEDDSLRDYRFTAGTSTPYPPEYWEVDRRSVPYTFLETSSKLRREIKKPFPPSGRNGQLSRAIADGFPHWSKLQHRAP